MANEHTFTFQSPDQIFTAYKDEGQYGVTNYSTDKLISR